MSLRDRVEAIAPKPKGCWIAEQLAALKGEARKELQELVDDHSISLRVLETACQAEGYNLITRATLQSHRLRHCRCYKGQGK